MAQKWKDVRKPLSPEAEERIQRGVQEAAAVMTLHQLRGAQSLTQVNLAKVLRVEIVSRRRQIAISSLGNNLAFAVAFVVSEFHCFGTTNYRILRATGTTTGNYVEA